MTVSQPPLVETLAQLRGLKAKIIGESVRVSEDGQTYIWDGDEWVLPDEFKLTGTIGADTNIALQTRRGDFDGQHCAVAGAVTALDGSGGMFRWVANSTDAPDADTIQVTGQTLGRWKRIGGIGGVGTLSGDTTGPSAGNTVVGIRSRSVTSSAPIGSAVGGQTLEYNGTSYGLRRQKADRTYFLDDIPGIVPNDINVDNGPVIQAWLNANLSGVRGAKLVVGPNQYYVATTIFLDMATGGTTYNNVGGITFEGTNAAGNVVGQTGSVFIWNGNDEANGCIFWLNSNRNCFRNISFAQRNAGNKHAFSLVILAKTPTATTDQTITRNHFVRCAFSSPSINPNVLAGTQSRLHHHIALGAPIEQNFNIESIVIEDCEFNNWYKSAVVLASGQPYNTEISRCWFQNGWSGPSSDPWGDAIAVFSGSASVNITRPDFQFCAICVYSDAPSKITLTHHLAENCKTLIRDAGGTSAPASWTIRGGRSNWASMTRTGYRPDGDLAASDTFVVSFGANGCVVMEAVWMMVDYLPTPAFQISCNGGLTLLGSTFPNTTPVYRHKTQSSNSQTVTTKDCRGFIAANALGPVTQYADSLRNDPFLVTIYDASTSVAVELPYNEANNRYQVVATCVDYTGTPAAGSRTAYVVRDSRTTSQFTLAVETAPGAGNSVTFSVILRPTNNFVGIPTAYEIWRSSTGVVLGTGSDIATWTGIVGGRVLQPFTGTPTQVVASANLNGLDSILFSNNNHELRSTLAASTWKFLHDAATGGTIYIVYYHASLGTNNASMVTTVDDAGNRPGVQLAVSGTTLRYYVNNSGGFTLANEVGPPYTPGKRWFMGQSMVTSQGNVAARCRASTSSAFSVWSTPIPASTSDPTTPFRIRFSGATASPVEVGEIRIYAKTVNDQEHARIIEELAGTWGAF